MILNSLISSEYDYIILRLYNRGASHNTISFNENYKDSDFIVGGQYDGDQRWMMDHLESERVTRSDYDDVSYMYEIASKYNVEGLGYCPVIEFDPESL
jgi:hypothetical protein